MASRQLALRAASVPMFWAVKLIKTNCPGAALVGVFAEITVRSALAESTVSATLRTLLLSLVSGMALPESVTNSKKRLTMPTVGTTNDRLRSEERRVGKSVDLG